MEKGLDVFADAIHAFARLGLKHRVLVIGEGPARAWFEQQLPDAIFTGQQTGTDLARALASSDVFLNPSVTEAFGNVTLEAMACALPVVAAEATGATNLVTSGVRPVPWSMAREPRGIRGGARGLCPRSGPAPSPWRGGTRRRQDDGLGHDQLRRHPRLQARDRQARAAVADDGALRLISPARCAALPRRGSRRSRAAFLVETVAADAVAERRHEVPASPGRSPGRPSELSRGFTSSGARTAPRPLPRAPRDASRPSSVAWNCLRGPSPAASSIRPMS